MASEDPKSFFLRLPRIRRGRFGPNERAVGETIAEFVARSRLTPQEIAWAQSQPVQGRPDLNRLRIELEDAGFTHIDLRLSEDREILRFKVRLSARVGAADNDGLLRVWITRFRRAGFEVTFVEVGIDAVDGQAISGSTLTGPLDAVCQQGAPAIELERG
jgi:hypothetical protein